MSSIAQKKSTAEELLDEIEAILNIDELQPRPYDATDRAIALELIERYIESEREAGFSSGLAEGRAGY